MTESERDEKFQRKFQISQIAAAEKAERTQKIFTVVGETLKATINYGKGNRQSTEKFLNNYFDYIQNSISDLIDLSEICKFLLVQKREYSAKVIEHDIKNEGLISADYQTAIDKIIVPILKQYESELEFEKKNTLKKQNAAVISNNSDLQKQNITENQKPNEPFKNVQIPLTEQTIPVIGKDVPELPADFSQISCEASKEQILNYFMILTKEKNSLNNKPYMEEADVIEFIEKNFSVFKTTPTGKTFPINLIKEQKGRLTYFMFQFHLKYDRILANTKIKYVKLLINNFEVFKEDKPEILITNMSESKSPKSAKNIILIDKYL